MSTEPESDLELQIAHVLLIDIVGYSKLLVNGQIELLQHLNRIVRETAHFRSAEASGKLMRLPTGDGMALLFFDSPEAPVQCALEISTALRQQPLMQLRMGVHSGPIKEVPDVNDRSNYAGAGINMAQRVLDCGDAGHILLSERSAEDLRSYQHWFPHLQDLGECEVKHGVRLRLFNLCKDGLGNPALPERVKCQRGLLRRLTAWGAASNGRKILLGTVPLFTLLAAALGIWLWLQASQQAEAKSIAVLPFANQSDEKANEYFVNGVQDEILTGLSKIADLKVINQASVMRFTAKAARDPIAIARKLGVSHVLIGSVQKVVDRVRVHAQLIDARSNSQIWGDSYDGELADVLTIQSKIAGQIAAQLQLKLSSQEKAAIAERPTNDPLAYDHYVRAKGLIHDAVFSQRGKEDLSDAVQLLTQATTRDPLFFLAYYQLAHAHDQLYQRFERTQSRLALAEAAIQVLQRLRPDSGETHLALAKHLYWAGRIHDRARQELEIARQSLPNEAVVPLLLAYIDRREGRWDDSTRSFERARALDPENSLILQQLSLSFLQLRRFPEMAAILDQAIALEPNNIGLRAQRAAVDIDWRADTGPLHSLIEQLLSTDPAGAATIADFWLDLALCERDAAGAVRALAFLGADGCQTNNIPFPRAWCEGLVARISGDEAAAQSAFLRARTALERLRQDDPNNGGALGALAMADAALGRKEEAIQGGHRAVELLPTSKDALNGPLLVGYLAIIYSWTGDNDAAIEQLERATGVPSYWSYGNLRLHPYWDQLRGDPRFENLVQSFAPK